MIIEIKEKRDGDLFKSQKHTKMMETGSHWIWPEGGQQQVGNNGSRSRACLRRIWGNKIGIKTETVGRRINEYFLESNYRSEKQVFIRWCLLFSLPSW